MKKNYLQNAKRFVRNSLSFFSFILLFFTTMQTYAQNPQCQWTEKIVGAGFDYAVSTSTDNNGNVYVAGDFDSPTLTFNNGITLANSGVDDAYLAKYNSDGVCQWAEKIAGTGRDEASSISTDANGNVYVVGYFQSYTLIFNNGISLANSGDLDGYIAKYNSDGICQWAEKIAGTNIEYARSISTDANANIYVAGYFKSSTLTFNNDIELLNSGSNDAFIARYNSDGMCQWAEKVAGTNVDNASSVSTDVNGNVYVTGDFFSDTLTFNNGITLSNSGGRRYSFIAKYNSDGICQWAERVAGGTDNDNTTSISTDANIYVAGNSWLDTPTFSNGITVSNSSNWDGFIAKYTDSETHVNPQLSFSSNNGIDQPLFLSPNPVKDNILNIAFNLLTPEQVTIEIANMLGELVSVVKSNELFPQGEHSSNVDISNLPAGAYFCILRFKDKFYQQKFIRY